MILVLKQCTSTVLALHSTCSHFHLTALPFRVHHSNSCLFLALGRRESPKLATLRVNSRRIGANNEREKDLLLSVSVSPTTALRLALIDNRGSHSPSANALYCSYRGILMERK